MNARESTEDGKDAAIQTSGEKPIMEGPAPGLLLSLLSASTPIEESFGDVDDPPPSPVSL